MKKAKTAKATKTVKTKRNSPVSRRNGGADRALSFDPVTKDDMPKQIKRAPKPAPGQRVRESVDRVMAECDKVDAALFEMTRATQAQDLPPLTIEEIDTCAGGGWAVVSADPQRPLTANQAKEIIAAVQSPGTPAPIGIAAE